MSAATEPSAAERFTSVLQEALADCAEVSSVRDAATQLREWLAPLKVIVVDAFDMRHDAPMASAGRWAVWGAASDGHCWQLTTDPQALTGLYLAERAAERA